MVARYAEHNMPGMLQPFEELAGLLELLGLGALREVAADDDEIGFQLVDGFFDCLNQALIMRAEMQVGKMQEAGHA